MYLWAHCATLPSHSQAIRQTQKRLNLFSTSVLEQTTQSQDEIEHRRSGRYSRLERTYPGGHCKSFYSPVTVLLMNSDQSHKAVCSSLLRSDIAFSACAMYFFLGTKIGTKYCPQQGGMDNEASVYARIQSDHLIPDLLSASTGLSTAAGHQMFEKNSIDSDDKLKPARFRSVRTSKHLGGCSDFQI